jgi:hypothetical protein
MRIAIVTHLENRQFWLTQAKQHPMRLQRLAGHNRGMTELGKIWGGVQGKCKCYPSEQSL